MTMTTTTKMMQSDTNWKDVA